METDQGCPVWLQQGSWLTTVKLTLGAPSVRRGVQDHLCVPGSVFFWGTVVLVVVICASSFLLYHRKACWRWIRQSEWMWPWGLGRAGAPCWPGLGPCPTLPTEALCGCTSRPPADVISELHLCYPVQTFQPKPEPVGE